MPWTTPRAVVFAAALGAPSTAAAASTDRFEPAREDHLLGLGGVDLATGWVPAGSAIQVSFDLHVGDTVRAEMLGEAQYGWDDESLVFVGDTGGGLYAIDIGVLLDGRVRFDLLGTVFESELIGPYDLVADGGALFDPYLLEGNPTRPALIDVHTEPTEVYTYSLIDVLIASGEFTVDAAFRIETTLQCASIEAVPSLLGQTQWIVEELAPASIPAPSADLQVDATLRCTTLSTVTVLLYPSVHVTLGLQTFELTPFELPVPVLVDSEAPFDFDAISLLFPAPPPPAAPADDSGGTSGSQDDGASDDLQDTGADSTGDGDTEGATSATGDAGCGCRHSGPFPTSGWLLCLCLGLSRRRAR